MQIELKIPLCSIGRRPLKQWAANLNANEVMKHFMGRPRGLEGVRTRVGGNGIYTCIQKYTYYRMVQIPNVIQFNNTLVSDEIGGPCSYACIL